MNTSCLRFRSILSILFFVMLATSATAYNPPVDTAGPLTVRIEFPEIVDRLGVPIEGHVILENRGPKPIDGQLSLEGIDRWTIAPARPIRFHVDAATTDTAKKKIAFKATAGEGTYSGGTGEGDAIHYPIHARATFTLDGQKQTAHPIRLFKTTFPRPKPKKAGLSLTATTLTSTRLAPDQRFCLLSKKSHRTFVVLDKDQAKEQSQKPSKNLVQPIGFEGTEASTGAAAAVGHRAGHPEYCLTAHPPYRDGQLGTIVREYLVALPESKPIRLDFGAAVIEVGQGDGATFRVRVAPQNTPAGTLGETVFSQHSAEKEKWTTCSADLSRFAGQTVRIQLETDPGPKRNTGWDSSYWSQLLLTAGNPPAPRPFPPIDDSEFQLLGTIESRGHMYTVKLRPGHRGLLDADIGFYRDDGPALYFRGFEIYYAGGRIDNGESATRLLKTTTQVKENVHEVTHHFLGPHGPMDLVIRLKIDRGSLQASFDLIHENQNAPPAWTSVHLENIATGPWSAHANQIYHGVGHVVRNPKAYRLGFDGHRLASSFVGLDFADTFSMVQAVDNVPLAFEARPEEHHYSLHVPYCPTLTLIPTENAFQGARRWREINGQKASPGVPRAAGRFVFDLWGGHYEASRKQLEMAFRYGLTDSMVVWHNWQRWGYDYRLPDIYPPNPKLGTEAEMKRLIETCKKADVPFALHDNYIDLYPDADGFSYEKHVAFNANGTPRRAWYNKGRDALSYKFNPLSIAHFLKPNLHLIHNRLAPTAYFIDVWSSTAPSECWTSDGRLITREQTKKIWGESFAWIRDLLGKNAPQISESGHDQLIGYLDAAQTNHLRIESPQNGHPYQFVFYIDCEDQERTCWFDTAHHDRFILHGAGYSSRYAGGLDPKMHGIYSDDYISTEVLTGHPGMVQEPFSPEVVRKYWLLSPLMSTLALRTINQVEFDGGPNGNLHRQHVLYSGGAEVWVNRGGKDWQVEGCTLPQYGFLARVPTKQGMIEASIERREGHIVEQTKGPDYLYVNTRPLIDDSFDAKLSVERFVQEGNRVKLDMKATVGEPLPDGYRLFLHIDNKDKIVEQPATDLAVFLKKKGVFRFTVTSSLPSYIEPGDKLIFTYGLWNPKSGKRLPLSGPTDGTHRVILGAFSKPHQSTTLNTLKVVWEPTLAQTAVQDRWKSRFYKEDHPIDFGAVATNGGFRLTKKEKSIIVTPLPLRGKQQVIHINPSALSWDLPKLVRIIHLDRNGNQLRKSTIPPRKKGEFINIEHDPKVFEYQLSSAKAAHE